MLLQGLAIQESQGIHDSLLLVLGLLLVMSVLYVFSQRVRIAPPIFLVLGGLALGFVPGIPRFQLEPDIVFLVFLPALLFDAAWSTAWYDFWKFRRPILMLAIGLVIGTSAVVALFSSSFIPGFTLATGFVLGAIVSPPDAVAATALLKNVGMTKRGLTILEGESLVNDASSLIIFRFAILTVSTGEFALRDAVGNFFMVAFMGVIVGLVIAAIMAFVFFKLPENTSINVALLVLTPYLSYLTAEEFHFSGVMSVVAAGLFISFWSNEIFTYDARLQSIGLWSVLRFLLNGLVFILIGLQLPIIVDGLGSFSLNQAILYGLAVSAVVILVRLLWVFPGTYIPRWINPKLKENGGEVSFGSVFVMGWAGMRGVVSLATALSIPYLLSDGTQFPNRSLILFITFMVILTTLIFQGLTLPWITAKLKIQDNDVAIVREEQELSLHLRMAQVALRHIDEKYNEEIAANEQLRKLRDKLSATVGQLALEVFEGGGEKPGKRHAMTKFKKVSREILTLQRKELSKVRREKVYEDGVLRDYSHLLDLDEARISKI